MTTRHTSIPADVIRQVLLTDWDPHDAARNEAAHGTYDGYIDPLRGLIESGGTEDQVVEFLHERERETMCFPSLGTQRLRRVAQRLLRLRRLAGEDPARDAATLRVAYDARGVGRSSRPTGIPSTADPTPLVRP